MLRGDEVMKDKTLVIMAAGMGSRFGGEKQIEAITDDGNFIIDYSIYDAIKCGFNRVVFVIKEENYEVFKDTIGKRVEDKIDVCYAFQKLDDLVDGIECPKDRVKPWGTGHAILSAKKYVKSNFCVINADDFYGRSSFEVASNYLDKISDFKCGVVGYKLGNTILDSGEVKRGVIFEENNVLDDIVESKVSYKDGKFMAYPLDKSCSFEVFYDTKVSMNMLIFSYNVFSYLEDYFREFLDKYKDVEGSEFLIPTYISKLMSEHNFSTDILDTSAKWLGMTYREDLDYVKKEIKKLHDDKVYPKKLW